MKSAEATTTPTAAGAQHMQLKNHNSEIHQIELVNTIQDFNLFSFFI